MTTHDRRAHHHDRHRHHRQRHGRRHPRLRAPQPGAKVLILERGGIPAARARELEPDRRLQRQALPHDRARSSTRDGKPFRPSICYGVGGNTKVYGAALPRLRREDFGVLETEDGVSPAWPITLRRARAVLRRGRADLPGPWRDGRRPDRAAALRRPTRFRPSRTSRSSPSSPSSFRRPGSAARTRCSWASTSARAGPASAARPVTASRARCSPRATPRCASSRPALESPDVVDDDRRPRGRSPARIPHGPARSPALEIDHERRAQARDRQDLRRRHERDQLGRDAAALGLGHGTRTAWRTRPALSGAAS